MQKQEKEINKVNSRILKFRAWDKENKKMLPIHGVLAMIEFNQDNSISNIGVQEFVQVDEDGNGDWQATSYSGDRVELMQFTGLYDKNGKEIYEGDIVRYINKEKKIDTNYEIRFYRGGFMLFRPNQFGGKDIEQYDGDSTRYFEVIGNTYENPELLKPNNK